MDNGARLTTPPKPFFDVQERSSFVRYRTSLAREQDLTLRLTDRVMQRSDSRVCQEFCNKVRLDSYLECLYVLGRLAEGAIPSLVSPVSFAPTPLTIVDPETRMFVGTRPRPCLVWNGCHEFYQVSFLANRVLRVDALRWVGHWQVLEIDGDGHQFADHSEREQSIGLPTTRLRTSDIIRFGWEVLRKAA